MRQNKQNLTAILAVAVVGIGLTAGQAFAGVVFSNGITGSFTEDSSNAGDFPGFIVSNSDLLQGLTPHSPFE